MASKFGDRLKRMIKTPSEIKRIKKSAEISNSCMNVILKKLKEGNVTEKDIANAIDLNIKRQGAELAFPTIVTCGKRSVFIHAKPTGKQIVGLGYVDFGAKYKGYCTDVTIPFIKGKLSEEESAILHDTLEVYNRLVKSIKLGEYCWKLHESYSRFLRKKGYEVKHSLGHGLGIEVHEMPYITMPKKPMGISKKRRWERLKEIRFRPGMVFTIEPGIYVKGVGGCRIENSIFIDEHSPKILTNSRLIECK